MELRRYLSILRSRFWLILLTTILAGGIGYLSADTTPRYTARATLYVGSLTFDTSVQDKLSSDRFTAMQTVTATFTKMIDSEPIARRAVALFNSKLTPSEVVSATSASQVPFTQLIYIDVTERNPKTAQSIANALADAFVETVQGLEPVAAEGTVPRLPVYIFERAQLPVASQPTHRTNDTVLALLFGFVASAGLAFLLDYLDISVRTSADVERRLDLPVLGLIPDFGRSIPVSRWPGAGPTQRSGD